MYHAVKSIVKTYLHASTLIMPFKKHFELIPSATCKRGGAQLCFPCVDFKARKKGMFYTRLLYPEKRFPKVNNITGKKRFYAG